MVLTLSNPPPYYSVGRADYVKWLTFNVLFFWLFLELSVHHIYFLFTWWRRTTNGSPAAAAEATSRPRPKCSTVG